MKCGHPQRKIITDDWNQTIYTTLDFSATDICPYYITNEIAFQYEMQLELQVFRLNEAKVYLLSGASLNSLTEFEELKVGEVYNPKPSEVHVMIIQPESSTVTAPFAAFSIMNKSIRDYKELGVRYGQILIGISVILCIVGICMA